MNADKIKAMSVGDLVTDGIEDGQEFDEGPVDWLPACPEKGFFAVIESEPTDSLKLKRMF